MDSTKNIHADNLDGFIESIARDVATGTSLHNYHVACQLGKHSLKLDISKSPGGGAEGGYGTTSITTSVLVETDFHFVLYPEDVLISIGKLFGLQDVVLGYPEFDDKLIVKTNDAARLKNILAGEGVRKILYNMSGFSLKLESEDNGHNLDLTIQRGLTDVNELNEVLAMFYEVLTQVEASV